MPPFTPEQEARLREIVREEMDEDVALRRIWEGRDPAHARSSAAHDRMFLEHIRAGGDPRELAAKLTGKDG